MNYTINEIPDTAIEANSTDFAIMWQDKTKKISISNFFKKLVKKSEVANTVSVINENPVSSKAVSSLLTISASSTTITDAPPLQNGIPVKIFFTSEITGSDDTTVLQISYNGTPYNVKVPKDGALQNYVAFEVSSGVFKYLQAYTTLELLFDGTQFVIIGNPVVISGSNYLYYADGSHNVNEVTSGNMQSVTSNAVNSALTNLQQTATSEEYLETVITNNINTWLPNDNTSKIVNLVCRGSEYQLLCNKINTNNWNCLVNGNSVTWKIEFVNGTRTILEIATNSSIGRFISKYQVTENNTVETIINCNSGESQNYGFLALINYHSSSGDATTFDLRMIRTGYNGNYVSEQRIGIMNATGDQDDLTFIAQNNKIAIRNNSSSKRFDVTIIGFN